MDMLAAGAALTHLKTATDIAKAILDIRGASKVDSKVLELIRELTSAELRALDAVRAQAALDARVRDLEAQLAKREDWAAERKRYDLHEIIPGNFAYVEKGAVKPGKAVQALCQNCFEQERKSPLNLLTLGNIKLYECKACGARLSKG